MTGQKATQKIKAYAHRGYSPSGAENTLAAFGAAVLHGFRHVETDVRTTADGVLVVFHDEHVDRLTEGFGRVSELTYEQIATLRVAKQGKIPTFGELLAEFDDLNINVDLKDDAAVPLVAEALAEHQAHHRVVVASFSDQRRRRFTRYVAQRGMPAVRVTGGASLIAAFTALGWISAGPFQPWKLLLPQLRRLHALQVPVRQGPLPVITRGFVRRAHAAGLEVHAWVINDPRRMHQLLDRGVDAIMTDDAETLTRVYLARGIWPPATR
ncbi:glycerophosphodiester phosphodiesterase family protein [Zhihengliuella flava]|uniref:Glycerophosphoryl diester phosphodiesterase n=1 Tax=Zhihengliuella flava TaxID=1285193 RepID=A0A931DA42_9MICC|nr:glycerophosphodiester phosphodiesterase family protein [Zhihengliuella flava]MBG6084747.1 glycerophosphoryl diester phosphodiesterase [Zhihengliuella flava]